MESTPPKMMTIEGERGAPKTDAPALKEVSAPSNSASETSSPKFKPSWRFHVAFVALATMTIVSAIDATSLPIALPVIAAKIHGTAIEAWWSGTGFLLTATVFQPTFASFSHIFGRKPLTYVALIFFIVGSVVCGVSKNFTTMLIGRGIQGVGAGGIVTMIEILITDMVPLRERGKWFGFVSATWAIGSVSGPLIGGAFAQKASWRWIFWINLPIIGVGMVIIALFLKLHYTKEASLLEQLKRVDWFGSFLFIASMTSILIPISWGGVMYPWGNWRTLFPLIIGLPGLLGFAPYEIYVAKEPMIRFSIFSNTSSNHVFFQVFIHGIVFWSLLYFGPIYFQAVKGMTPIMSGVAMFPRALTVSPVVIIVGIITSVTGKYRWAIWVGWVISTLGMGIQYLLDVHTSTVAWIFLTFTAGLGNGVLFGAFSIAVPASSKTVDMAHAVAFLAFIRSLGQAIGVAISGTIFQNAMKTKLLNYPLLASMADEYSRDATGLVQVIQEMQRGLARDQLIQAYADALKVVWATMCGISALGLISSVFVKEFTLNVKMDTEQGFKHDKKAADTVSSDVEKKAESEKEG